MIGDYEGRLLKQDWVVRPVEMDIARRLIRNFHYARGYPNTRTFLHGLFRKQSFFDEDCQGVAWWIPPTRSCAESVFPQNWQGVLSLSRLVVNPGVPKNACTFLLSRSVKLIPTKDWPCLITYADPSQGHTGTIYRACNWTYDGLSAAEEQFTIDGVLTARKAGGRTRTRSDMLALGAVSQGKVAKHRFVLKRTTELAHSEPQKFYRAKP